MVLEYVKGAQFSLKRHPQFRESWLRDRIADDPRILGLGPLRLVDMERHRPHAGRLDLLLQQGQQRRYVVEIMLGRLNESHLVRALEYWDVERLDSPGFEYVAVLAAEELPPRLLRVAGLLRDAIPLVVLQMIASRMGNQFSLHFVRVLEGPGRVRPKPVVVRPGGRPAWEEKGCAAAVATLDACLGLLREIGPGLHLDYQRKSLAVLPAPGAPPLLVFFPRRHFLRVEIQPPHLDPYWTRCAADWPLLEAERLLHAVQLMLFPGDVERKRAGLRRVLAAACQAASTPGAGTHPGPRSASRRSLAAALGDSMARSE